MVLTGSERFGPIAAPALARFGQGWSAVEDATAIAYNLRRSRRLLPPVSA